MSNDSLYEYNETFKDILEQSSVESQLTQKQEEELT